jgi:hypothetical protein
MIKPSTLRAVPGTSSVAVPGWQTSAAVFPVATSKAANSVVLCRLPSSMRRSALDPIWARTEYTPKVVTLLASRQVTYLDSYSPAGPGAWSAPIGCRPTALNFRDLRALVPDFRVGGHESATR